MKDIGKILRGLRLAAGQTKEYVAEYVSDKAGKQIGSRAIEKWEQGISQPNAMQFMEVCSLYKVTNFYATFGVGNNTELNALGLQRLSDYAKLLLLSEDYRENPTRKAIRIIPLYDLAVSAGTGQYLNDSTYEELEIDDTISELADYALRITGDSMEPRFINGQIVYVHKQKDLNNGEIGIFALNDDSYIKRLDVVNEQIQLTSLNTAYPPIIVREHDRLDVMGRVVG